MAAYFPEWPTREQSQAADGVIRGLATLYPCGHCAEDFRAGIAERPPVVSSRAGLSVWMCEAHNRVNRLLGKEEFPCEIAKLYERWRNGGARCDLTSLASEREPE